MSRMAHPSAGIALWNWALDARVPEAHIHAALAGALGRPVLALGRADPAHLPVEAVLCDVWHNAGDFPTSVDCYRAPHDVAETTVVAAFARRIGRRCLLPDDTLNPRRYLLAAPDGTLRPAYVDVADGDDGPILSHLRLCTVAGRCCREWAQCGQSRWAPDSVVAARAAA